MTATTRTKKRQAPVSLYAPMRVTLEHAKQRASVTLVHGRLAWRERNVRHHPGKPVALGRVEVREHFDPADLLCRHHEMRAARPSSVLQSMAPTASRRGR